jgi:hypothetical protein
MCAQRYKSFPSRDASAVADIEDGGLDSFDDYTPRISRGP